jgi:hypothetical protein
MPSLIGLYPAPTYVPEARTCYSGPDLRVRCRTCGKVVFDTREAADRSAAGATLRGTPMRSYNGGCGHWHVTRIKKGK